MPLSADGVYSETLLSIISAKLQELDKKRDAFETSKINVLNAVHSQPDTQEQLRILLDGVKRCFKIEKTAAGFSSTGIHSPEMFKMLSTMERFLQQPRFDPSVSQNLLREWKKSLLRQLDVQSSRFEYATLYARLVTDWLSADKALTKNVPQDNDIHNSIDTETSYDKVDNANKIEARLGWERSVFEPASVSAEQIDTFLHQLFGESADSDQSDTSDEEGEVYKALCTLRQSVASLEEDLGKSGQFNEEVLRWCINGLLSGDSLSREKRAVLKDFSNNTIILAELADVLNLRMANIDGWNWGPIVTVEQRRTVNGEYNVHMHEDLLQAIFLQYIGVKWGVFFRRVFIDFVKTGDAWLSLREDIPIAHEKRRKYFLDSPSQVGISLHKERRSIWLKRYFMTQLPRTEYQTVVSNDGDEEANYGAPGQAKKRKQVARGIVSRDALRMQMASSAAARVEYEDESDEDMGFGLFDGPEPENDNINDYDDENPRSLMELKQGLLRLLRTEVLINTRLHGGLTAFRGRFEDWNRLLPHATVISVLRYLGMTPRWVKFIETYMQAPLAFKEGGNVESARIRRRGVPASHPLSDVLSEVILFCMDLSINKECEGASLHRIHDDFWFWHPSGEVCDNAWSLVKRFVSVMGLTLDEEKAGSAQIVRDSKQTRKATKLPQRPIRWGFLYLDSKSGQFEIDQEIVEYEIKELKKQLQEKEEKGVFAWIQAWNVYADNFFTTNFGKPATSFGGGHIDRILSTLERLQRLVFDGSNVVTYLQSTLGNKYGIQNVPEGFCFFPAQLGGLELRNPFVNLLQLDGPDNNRDPEAYLDTFLADEREMYATAKRSFENTQRRRNYADHFVTEEEKDTFFSFEEYTRYRESMRPISASNSLATVFNTLQQVPQEAPIEASSAMLTALNLMDSSGVIRSGSGINGHWHSMTSYWKWICQLYGPEIVERFGGLNMVDNGVLPIGMVSLVREERVSWS